MFGDADGMLAFMEGPSGSEQGPGSAASRESPMLAQPDRESPRRDGPAQHPARFTASHPDMGVLAIDFVSRRPAAEDAPDVARGRRSSAASTEDPAGGKPKGGRGASAPQDPGSAAAASSSTSSSSSSKAAASSEPKGNADSSSSAAAGASAAGSVPMRDDDAEDDNPKERFVPVSEEDPDVVLE